MEYQSTTTSNPYLAYMTAISQPLADGEAEIRFFDGGIVYRSHRNGQQQIKGLSPQSLRLAFADAPIDSGWHSPNLVRNGLARHWWGVEFYPSRIYWLLAWGQQFKIPLPSFYWFGTGNTYYLVATDSDKHHPENTLYYPPVTNIVRNLSVCWGNASPPQANATTIMDAWSLFWNSEFTRHNVEGRTAQGNVVQLWQTLHDRKRKRFSPRDLLPLGTTLEQLIQNFSCC